MRSLESEPQAEEISLPLSWGVIRGRLFHRSGTERMIALHGWQDNSASFDPLLRCLRADAAVLAMDFSGHGTSDHRAQVEHYSYVDWLSEVEDARAALGWESCWLLGHSLGGAIASMYAAIFPQRARGLLLLDGVAQIPALPRESCSSYRKYFAQRAALREKSPRTFASLDEIVERRLRATPMSRDGARRIMERNAEPSGGGFRLRTDPRLSLPNLSRLTLEQSLSHLASIYCPALVLRARPGYDFDDVIWRQLAEAIPSAHYRTVEGSHYVHLEAPARVAGAISEFWRERSV